MKITLVPFSILAVVALAPAQDRPKLDFAASYDFSAKKVVTAANLDVRASLTDIAGIKGLGLDIYPLLGTVDTTRLTLGGIAAFRVPLSNEYFASLGLGFRWADQEKGHGYLFAGFGRRF